MKKIYLLSLLIISIFMMSCGGHFFNPRYYYNNRNSSSGDNTINIPDAEVPPEVSADEDPFKVNSDYNKPNYGGYEASKFDKWLFKSSFQNNKLPVYQFFEDPSRYWTPGGSDWNKISANFYKANDGENSASGFPISAMSVYKYDGANPLYDNKGYLPGRMDRFRFYSIYGKTGGGIVTLQQYLIAVDTYSKFVFAFGRITDVTSIFGDKVPMQFEAIEYYGNKIHFYEYDPIGYVDISGDVIFYQHYIEQFVANPTGYLPKQKGYENYAEHDPYKPGKSPYFPLNDNTEASADDQQKYKNDIKTYLGNYQYRDYSGYKPSGTSEMNLKDWRNGGYVGKSLILYTYQFTTEDQLVVQEKKFGEVISSTAKTYNLKMINTSYKATYVNASDPSDTISISIVQDDNGVNTIAISGKVLNKNFKDNGAIFTDRVKEATFINEKEHEFNFIDCTYVESGTETFKAGSVIFKFNNDGSEFTMTLNGREYKFVLGRFDNDDTQNFTAVYKCTTMSGAFGSYARVSLIDGDGYNNIVISQTLGWISAPITADDFESVRQ